MKATLRYTLMGLTFAGLTFLSTSCRKDLCYDHDEHGLSVKVNLSSDWEQEWERTYAYDWEKLWEEDWKYDYEDLCPAPADGIRVQVYTSDGQRIESNLPDEGGRIAMPEGTHELLFYNNDTEYIVFDGVAASESATATTRGVTRSSFHELHAGERTVNQPDMLYGAYMEEYTAEKNTCPDGAAGYLASIGLHLYDTLRVRKRTTIRGLGTRSLGRHGRNGLSERWAYRRNRSHGNVRLYAGRLRSGSAGTVVRRTRLSG